VYPEYVREAYRLLQKSIILVENEDIELEDIEEVGSARDVVHVVRSACAIRCVCNGAMVQWCCLIVLEMQRVVRMRALHQLCLSEAEVSMLSD
jgi:hypothetical protein